MALNPPQYDLTLEQALARLEAEVEKNQQQTDTPLLQGMTPDQAYNVGYETCLRDLQSLTGPDPMEFGVVTFEFEKKDETNG
jgi:hypothetical protein